MVEYLKKYGPLVIENGYDICFIRVGEKRPFGNDWEAKKHTLEDVESADGRMGVGIKTARSPGVDIDCYNVEIVEKVKKFTQELCGETLCRVGLPPKTLLPYRCSKPFPKQQSSVFIDDQGRSVKLEVLADGQQYVALHVHPDTKEPYRWKDKRHPGNTPRSELPPITQDQAKQIADYFEKLAIKAGWQKKSTVKRLESERGKDFDYDDPFITDKAKVDISDEKLRAKLHTVDNPDDYDTWFHIGMALFHQYDGSQEGLMLWHEWSVQAANYDAQALEDKWDTFNVEGKKREPITARFILKQAKQVEEKLATVELAEIEKDVRAAPDVATINELCDKIKTIAFDALTREKLIGIIQLKIFRVSNTKVSLSTVRKMVRYENPDNSAVPKWLEEFCYIQQDDTFYSRKTRQALTTKVFDATYARYMLTKRDLLEGKATPEHSASQVALNRYQIQYVANRMYLPGDDDIFSIGGLNYVNSYSNVEVPEKPENITKADKHAIMCVERHIGHLFENERDQKLLLSWLCHIVQTNGRTNWAIVAQGVEGDGKSWFNLLMAAVLGAANVRSITGDSLAENYTSWAESTQFCMIEEIRLHGKNRFDVLNKVKPFLTNQMVSIRRMRTDLYEVLNTVNYFMTTQHKDGVPIGQGDTRYYPLFSRFQLKADLDAFNKENPTYYTELHEALSHGPAIRQWMLDYELHKDFDPKRRATPSSARKEMLYLNQSDEDEALNDALDTCTNPSFSRTLLRSNLVHQYVEEAPTGRMLKVLLSESGFTYLGYAKDADGKVGQWWSQKPKLFLTRRGGEAVIDAVAIRNWVRGSVDEDDI